MQAPSPPKETIPHAKVPLPPAATLPFDPLGAAGNSEAEYWQRLEPVLESELGQRIQRIVEAKTMAADVTDIETAENVAVEEVKLDEAGENERISDEPAVIAEQGTDSQQSDGFFTPGTDSPNPESRCSSPMDAEQPWDPLANFARNEEAAEKRVGSENRRHSGAQLLTEKLRDAQMVREFVEAQKPKASKDQTPKAGGDQKPKSSEAQKLKAKAGVKKGNAKRKDR
jgi:hypothetical protein